MTAHLVGCESVTNFAACGGGPLETGASARLRMMALTFYRRAPPPATALGSKRREASFSVAEPNAVFDEAVVPLTVDLGGEPLVFVELRDHLGVEVAPGDGVDR